MSDILVQPSRRSFLASSGLTVAATLLAESASAEVQSARQTGGTMRPLAERFSPSDTAVVFIDPQNDVLSEHGLAYAAVRESLKQNNTIDNMERIFKAAKAGGYDVFISPHYFFPEDHGWKFNGPLEADELREGLFDRKGRLIVEGLQGFRCRLARTFQAIYRGRQNDRRFTASDLGAADKRSRHAAAKTQDRKNHFGWNAREHVR